MTNISYRGPSRVLIVGNGRVARAFLDQLNRTRRAHTDAGPSSLPFVHWHRGQTASLHELCLKESPTHVWLAVSDDSIAEFVQNNIECLIGRTVTHFCGGKPSFRVSHGHKLLQVHVAHPLTTFGDVTHAQWRDDFDRIPFVLEKPIDESTPPPKLDELLPGFTNPVFYLAAKDRAYYHALCALAGGLTVQLWEALATRFQFELGVPSSALHHFLHQISRNLSRHLENRKSVLTGPVARGDHQSVVLHKSALDQRHEVLLARLYQDFETLHRCEHERSLLEKRGN